MLARNASMRARRGRRTRRRPWARTCRSRTGVVRAQARDSVESVLRIQRAVLHATHPAPIAAHAGAEREVVAGDLHRPHVESDARRFGAPSSSSGISTSGSVGAGVSPGRNRSTVRSYRPVSPGMKATTMSAVAAKTGAHRWNSARQPRKSANGPREGQPDRPDHGQDRAPAGGKKDRDAEHEAEAEKPSVPQVDVADERVDRQHRHEPREDRRVGEDRFDGG